MKLSEIKKILAVNPDKTLSFVLPNGEAIPGHFHITEVDYISKRFIDCGATQREANTCQLQLWLGNDREHQLTSGKAATILDLGESVLPAGDLDVEVEYEDSFISQYAIDSSKVEGGTVSFHLAAKHTDCLAKEACGVGVGEAEESCCGKSGVCC